MKRIFTLLLSILFAFPASGEMFEFVNKSGGTLNDGHVVIVDTTANQGATTTTTATIPELVFGIVFDDSVADDATGLLVSNGRVLMYNSAADGGIICDGAVSRGDYLELSTSNAGQAAVSATQTRYSFARALTADASAPYRVEAEFLRGPGYATAFHLADNVSALWGDDSDYQAKFNSTSGDLEVHDGTNNFIAVSDEGTTAKFGFNTTTPAVLFQVESVNTDQMGLFVSDAPKAYFNNSSNDGQMLLRDDSGNLEVTITVDAASTITDGLNLGTATGAGTGDLVGSGEIEMQGSGTNKLGISDTTRGYLQLLGGSTASGGLIDFFTPADADTNTDLYRLFIDSVGDFYWQIRGGAGSNDNFLRIDETTRDVFFNDSGVDNDFTIETDNEAQAFFLDAGNDRLELDARFRVALVTDAGPMTATNGIQGEIVFNTSDSKLYVCTVTGTPATWAACN